MGESEKELCQHALQEAHAKGQGLEREEWTRMWGEEFGELIKGEKKNENMQQTAQNPDYNQGNKEVHTVIPPRCLVL